LENKEEKELKTFRKREKNNVIDGTHNYLADISGLQ
jgi:hypothetical protein